MNADIVADLMKILRPALSALTDRQRARVETALARLEVDVARWAARYNVTPEALDRARSAFQQDESLRRSFHEAVTAPDHVRSAS